MSSIAGGVDDYENDGGKGNGESIENAIAISDNTRYDETDLELSREFAEDYYEPIESNISNEVMNGEGTDADIYNIASNNFNSIEDEHTMNVNSHGAAGRTIGNNIHTVKSGTTIAADNVPHKTANQDIYGINVLHAYVDVVKDSTRKNAKAFHSDSDICFETEEPDQIRSVKKKPEFGTKRKNIKKVSQVGDAWNDKAISKNTKPKKRYNTFKTLNHDGKTVKGSTLKENGICSVRLDRNGMKAPHQGRKNKVALELVRLVYAYIYL